MPQETLYQGETPNGKTFYFRVESGEDGISLYVFDKKSRSLWIEQAIAAVHVEVAHLTTSNQVTASLQTTQSEEGGCDIQVYTLVKQDLESKKEVDSI